MQGQHHPIVARISATIATLFGALTIKAGGAVLFFDGPAREAAGNYVPFVLWFNFIAGFFYIATGIGLWRGQRWGLLLATTLAVSTLGVFASLGLHILNNGAYETRTVIAMSIRSSVWVTIAAVAWLTWPRSAVAQNTRP